MKFLYCCTRCEKYNECIPKWLLAEKGQESNCCPECKEFYGCLSENAEQRWRTIHEM